MLIVLCPGKLLAANWSIWYAVACKPKGRPQVSGGPAWSWHSRPLIWGHIGHGRLFGLHRDNGLRGRRQPGSCNWRILAPALQFHQPAAPLRSKHINYSRFQSVFSLGRSNSCLRQTGKFWLEIGLEFVQRGWRVTCVHWLSSGRPQFSKWLTLNRVQRLMLGLAIKPALFLPPKLIFWSQPLLVESCMPWR